MQKILPLTLAFGLLCGVAAAQCAPTTLALPYNSNNGQSGNMIDVLVTDPVGITLTSIAVNMDAVADTVEIYYKPGSYVGAEVDPTQWTLLGSEAVNGAGLDVATPVFCTNYLNQVLAPGNHAFYITLTTSTGINYTNGTAVGNVLSSDASLTVYEGVGKSYPFGSTFMPRLWNGTLYYRSNCTTSVPAAGSDWQVNGSELSLLVDGVAATACGAATSTSPFGTVMTFTLGSGVSGGIPFEVALSPVPLVPGSAGGIPLGTDTINVDIFNPLSFLNGGLGQSYLPFPVVGFPGATNGVSFSIDFALGAPSTLSMQAIGLDAAAPLGLRISQGSQVTGL